MSSSSSLDSSPPSSPIEPTGKPPIPYVVGASFIAKRHQPPSPYGSKYQPSLSGCFDCDKDQQQLAWCISNPPAPGVTFPEDICHFTITNVIRTGEDCGAQVVRTNTGLVAKIFDPLYYNFDISGLACRKHDVSALADWEYSYESGAYLEVIGNKIQGTIMPKYYGSWTLDIPYQIDATAKSREVRLVLLEDVPGVRMLDLSPNGFTQEERENIMRKLIEAKYDLRLAGIEHGDVSPRNVMLYTDSNFADPNMRLTLLDYGCSSIYRIRFGGPPLRIRHNPCFEWACASLWSSYGWLPHGEERVRWVYEVWGEGMGGKYIKVERDPDHPLGCPIEPNWTSDSNSRDDAGENCTE